MPVAAALAALLLVVIGGRVLPGLDRAPLVAVAPVTTVAVPDSPTLSPTATVPTAEIPTAKVQKAKVPTPTPDQVSAEPSPPAEKKAAASGKVPARGPGTYSGVQASLAPASTGGTLKRYDVRVEKGLSIDPEKAARLIEQVLNDKRSWRGTGRWRFQLVPTGQPAELHAYIVTPGTTDKLCAPLLTQGEVSCQNGSRVVLNAKRWTYGVKYYGDDVANYRRYLINHEFGHALGHNHVRCPGRGQPAPVMMQQTKGLDGCRKNPWPLPTGD